MLLSVWDITLNTLLFCDLNILSASSINMYFYLPMCVSAWFGTLLPLDWSLFPRQWICSKKMSTPSPTILQDILSGKIFGSMYPLGTTDTTAKLEYKLPVLSSWWCVGKLYGVARRKREFSRFQCNLWFRFWHIWKVKEPKNPAYVTLFLECSLKC